MRPNSRWIIITGTIICIILAIWGGLSYPLTGQGIVDIILYEIPVFIGVAAISVLIYMKGAPDS
jgi:hypothetical protein